ncbi:hypothetical protein [Winogradskyella helgolandensis]|uniref:hypothetical protein n=1 Tax=Winogradskyella helgolandensis TaxID=2697010 RepID=UPI001FD3FF51|nr:hypothetical protein [Winogradskyella helgolandensis]
MNKFLTLLAVLILTANTFAQAPEKMSYQAVVRDSGDNLVTNQAVGMQISILQGSASGTAVYVETQTPTTNTNGLVSIEIGTGSLVSGNFSTIDWSADSYFVKTETDPTGGTTYTITGTSELLSVPYALHAKTADNAFSGDYNDLTNKPSLQHYGDIKQGFQPVDHDGWVRLDGRLISSLTATQQTQAMLLSFTTNLPNATNAYLSQNEATLGELSGTNTKNISQNQLPNVALSGSTSSGGNHTHNLYMSSSTTGTNGIQSAIVTSAYSSSFLSGSVQYAGNHSHTITTASLNGDVTQVAFDVKPKTMSVNTFIYLGN